MGRVKVVRRKPTVQRETKKPLLAEERKLRPRKPNVHIKRSASQRSLLSLGTPGRADALAEKASTFWNTFLEFGSLADLKKAIKIDRLLLKEHKAMNDPREVDAAQNLGVTLLDLYNKTNDKETLDEAQSLLEYALSKMPDEHPSLARAKINLGNVLRAQCERSGDDELLDKAIELYEAGLRGTPLDHPSWDLELRKSCLARGLISRGTPADLSRAMSLMAAKVVRGSIEMSSLPSRKNILGLPVPNLSSHIRRITDFPSGCGGFADIYMAEWIQPRKGRTKVAIKVLRASSMDFQDPIVNERINKLLKAEVGIWHELDHPNIVKLLGTCDTFGPHLSMVCPWATNGSMPGFLQRHRSLIYAERLRLIREIAAGLFYLHSNAIIHGDLSGANILITDDQHACLSDFGLSVLAQDMELQTMTHSGSAVGGSLRWTAPELFDYGEVSPKVTLFSDVYSFGSVALEVFTGERPYHYVQSDMEVLLKYVIPKITPARPKGVWDAHWKVIEECWATDPHVRPSSKALCDKFSEQGPVSIGVDRRGEDHSNTSTLQS